ncbi:GNAT family N-acetyltransferase [Amphritea balenae]|nr:GNAT family N-acetyltransferase [Amphritea balenae]GGK58270.1 hypothetical protein GCM10007941_05450 [Amphritea balenae]
MSHREDYSECGNTPVKAIEVHGRAYHFSLFNSDYKPVPDEIEQVSVGKATLRFFMGSDEIQKKFFAKVIRWDRFVGVRCADKLVGYAAIYRDGVGPYDAGLKDFIAEFGMLSGSFKFGLYRLFEMRYSRSECYLFKLYVSEEYRGKGLGESLIDFLFGELKLRGLGSLDLEVYQKNEKAIRFYERLGFVTYKIFSIPLVGRFFPDSVVFKMRKDIK